jgi:hypothetical protein
MSIENLPSNPKILPPIAKKQCGRPKTKRIRKGAWKRKGTHYRNCGATGHNRVGCQSAPASNGRQWRARDRELSQDSSPEASEGSDSGDSGGSNELDGSDELEDQ